LRNAVIGLLNQTHRFIRIIVINDGDRKPPWPVLSDIADPRLIRFDLPENRGPYFALAVALESTSDPLFLVQDADDWSVPHRAASLLQMLTRDGSSYAFSSVGQFRDYSAGRVVIDKPMFSRMPDITPSAEFKLRIPHHGLFRTSVLESLGGYFGGFKFNYDEFITNVLLLSGTVSWSCNPLYWRRLRPTSLTRASDTGMASGARRLIRARLGGLYQEVYSDYVLFLGRRLSGENFLQRVRWRVQVNRGAASEQRIKYEAARLRSAMRAQAHNPARRPAIS
jgi:glycosyltransferase involved in cell wall biosynthesis